LREIAVGVEPAHWNGKAATLIGGLAHVVSILSATTSAGSRAGLDDNHASATASSLPKNSNRKWPVLESIVRFAPGFWIKTAHEPLEKPFSANC
jgi:hypothetical protein